MAKVSVLMPVYNGGKFLAQAIESIGFQSFTDWELIIVDDGSTDNTCEIAARYRDSRIYYLKNETNLGLIKTLNKGIGYCSGEYIARMDADDISEINRLQHQVEFMDAHPDYIMCGTGATVISSGKVKSGKIKNLTRNAYLQMNLLFSSPFVHPSMIIRRDVLLENRYDETFLHAEDYELWCRLATKGKIANLNRVLLQYRWHDTNVSVLNASVQDEQKDRIIKRQLALLDIEPTEEDLWCHKITFQLYKLGKKQTIAVDKMNKVSGWFARLLKNNKEKRLYDQDGFCAFLWTRWCVLCFSQRKYLKAFCPPFARCTPCVLRKLCSLIFKTIQK